MSDLLDKKTPEGKGLRTAYQTVVGTVVAYFAGLVTLPAVREYTIAFVRTEGVAAVVAVLTALGISAGLVAFLQNKFVK